MCTIFSKQHQKRSDSQKGLRGLQTAHLCANFQQSNNFLLPWCSVIIDDVIYNGGVWISAPSLPATPTPAPSECLPDNSPAATPGHLEETHRCEAARCGGEQWVLGWRGDFFSCTADTSHDHSLSSRAHDCQSTHAPFPSITNSLFSHQTVSLHSGLCRTVTEPVNVSVVIVTWIISCILYFKDNFSNAKYNKRSISIPIKKDVLKHSVQIALVLLLKWLNCLNVRILTGCLWLEVIWRQQTEQKLLLPPELRLRSNFSVQF